ncbi:MAG: beta-aspartyl-peptidase [Victivallales bacterium]|nr:beta-aspartyl-peptidase [Victivallales bacterium]MCF7888731.1 beta-aspartyl-peptidase [Victivallales bacterium]
MKLIRNGEVYAPDFLGKKDILTVNDKIIKIEDSISASDINLDIETIDASGKYIVPGFIDQHVHIIGGGGEAGFSSRIPETQLTDFTRSGITTVLALLGTDATNRSLENLLAKVRSLEDEGLTAYMLTGSYEFPSHTLTGSIRRDIILIDKIVGAKIAVSDHRASYVTALELARVASDARVAGMLSGKPGIVTVHVGSGKERLNTVLKAIEDTEIPKKHFMPTHVNRSAQLYEQAVEFAKNGGFIDFTADTSPETTGQNSVKVSRGIRKALEAGVREENISVSSDGNGSWSVYDSRGHLLKIGVSQLNKLHLELKDLVFEEKLSLGQSLKFITSNVAKILQVYPEKGVLKQGSDADILILDNNLDIDSVYAKGKTMVFNKSVVKKGMFEDIHRHEYKISK